MNKGRVRTVVRALAGYLKCTHDEVSVYFVTTKQICALHDEFFNDLSPTDCISFPIDKHHLGEIFVCPETAVHYAQKHNLDPRKELTLYLVHGILHCLGFDDLTPPEKRRMRKKEKQCMCFLDMQGLIL